MTNGVFRLDSIGNCNEHLSIKQQHPLISVVKLSELKNIPIIPLYFGVYGILCNISNRADNAQHQSDTDEVKATLRFVAPGHTCSCRSKVESDIDGWLLLFHPDIIKTTVLEHYISVFPFFDAHKSLYINSAEFNAINNYMQSLYDELHEIDSHTHNIVISGISVILCLCMRYFERQSSATDKQNQSLIVRLERLLNNHLSERSAKRSIPTVAWCASQLNLSPNYFGDLVKRQTGRSAQESIQRRIIDEAKMLLTSGKFSVSEVAYRLGFKYPHHLTRMFKRLESCTPNRYRRV